VKNGVYASWEVQHGFNNENALRKDESRASECEIKPHSERPRLLLSHSQWKARGRRVIHRDSSAARSFITQTGHNLCLFSEEQTVSAAAVAARKK
jgi:hypothetical protein